MRRYVDLLLGLAKEPMPRISRSNKRLELLLPFFGDLFQAGLKDLFGWTPSDAPLSRRRESEHADQRPPTFLNLTQPLDISRTQCHN